MYTALKSPSFLEAHGQLGVKRECEETCERERERVSDLAWPHESFTLCIQLVYAFGTLSPQKLK